MMTTTENATEKLRDNLLQKCLDAGLGFRLMGNSPIEGTLSIKVDRKSLGDKVVESGGIKFYLDPVCAVALENYELDYLDGPEAGFFLKSRKAGDTTTNFRK